MTFVRFGSIKLTVHPIFLMNGILGKQVVEITFKESLVFEVELII